MKKLLYIDMIEKIVGAYSTEDILNYIAEVEEYSIREHGFPRLTANIGILLAHGRRTELREIFVQMMNLCCEEIPVVRDRYPDVSDDPAERAKYPEVGNNFSVREVICCLLLLEEKKTFPTDQLAYWRKLLKRINPYTCYSVIAKNPVEKIDNWAAFGAASEQSRKFAGIGGKTDFIDTQVASQLLSFDENGMYRDPNEPIVYDITTRLQLLTVLYFGYDGLYREKLEEVTALGALHMLQMQSVTGEVPFGGRSNQFLHNEATLAAVCEYEACRYYKKGDTKIAGQFKAAAKLATDSILSYLNAPELYHVKNCFPKDSFFGCENYAHFKKYMVTTASFLYLAYLFADDDIESTACPAEVSNHIFETTPHFHKTVCKFGEYFLEYETNADFHYDSNGLGRIHKKGVPPSLCLSTPFTKTPNYGLDIKNPSNLSICCSIHTEKTFTMSCDAGTKYVLLNQRITDNCATIEWHVTLNTGVQLLEKCSVSDNGIHLSFEILGKLTKEEKIYCMLPAFKTDGVEKSIIRMDKHSLEIDYKGHTCRYNTTGNLQDTGTIYANRNGHYQLFSAQDTKKIEVNIVIE